MTTTLTLEMRKALEEAGEQPLEIFDSETHDCYMLMRADVFDRLHRLFAERPLVARGAEIFAEQAGRRARLDDPEMDIYYDLAPQRS